MEKHIVNEQTGINYTLVGDYYIPNLTLPEEEHVIGQFGRQHLGYLKEQRPVVYTELLTSGRLNAYLCNVDTQAQEMYEHLVVEYADKQGLTEQLKAEKQMEWVGRMNNINNAVEEVILQNLLYC